MAELVPRLSIAEYAKCREFLRFCVTLQLLIDAVASVRIDISIAELYDLLKDNEILRRNQDLARLILRNTIEHLVNVDENLGEAKYVITRRGVPVYITAAGVAELVAYLSTLHAISGCQI
jgi:hypothetical protein